MQRLNSKATGKDNSKYQYPSNFVKEDEMNFERPYQPSLPGTGSNKPADTVKVDIERPVLTANGKDSTFITFTFRDCNGELIPYEKEIEFEISSKEGTTFEIERYEDTWNNNKYLSRYLTYPKQAIVKSDGPELTLKVIAPRTTKLTGDTITVTPVSKTGSCKLPTATASLTYEPKAEIQMDILNDYPIIGQTTVTATLARPGGDRLYSFNGYLKLESLNGLTFDDSNPNFYSGQATAVFDTPRYLVKDEITATAISRSTIYEDELYTILNKKFSIPVSFAPPIIADTTCKAEQPEIGFVIDSSGSMKRNDPKRFRVDKTKEFIYALNADNNIATHFTTSGMFLSKGFLWTVANSVDDVREAGGTDISKGLAEAFRWFSTDRQKYVVLLTDGKSSKEAVRQQVKIAQSRDIRIFVIGLGNDVDEAFLKEIARDTLGSYHHIQDSIELPLVYQSILQKLNCGIPMPTCSLIASVFDSPSVKLTNSDVLMETVVSDACGTIGKVIVRFSSRSGDLDYELAHRGHNIYMMNKGQFEIQDFQLASHATFLAYDQNGYKIGEQKVTIQK